MSPKLAFTNPRKSNSILEKFYFRECNVNRNPLYFTNDLSSTIAWNTTRLQNMIVAVGPGTPSSCTHTDPRDGQSDQSSSDSLSQQDENEEEEDSSNSIMFEDVADMSDEDIEEGQDGDSTSSDEGSGRSQRRETGEELREDHLPHSTSLSYQKFAPSLRHRGCINTACWLQTPWRLSLTPSTNQTSFSCNESISIISPSIETPTQLITSGDDRVVKFWDVRHAMGNVSPVESPATSLPFAYPGQELKFNFNKYYPKHLLPGGVVPLYSLNTGHRGNIFHVEALPFDAGKVLTCAADGYLRLSDIIVSNSPSTVVLGPNTQGSDHFANIYSSRNGMCFSFHLINSNVGLLCTERGLKKFDLRLSPRQQSHDNVLHQDRGALCKACAIWKKATIGNDNFYEEDVGSHYVFAGGSGAEVRLYDLRMETGNSTSVRVVQKYRPRSFLSDNLSTNGRGRTSSRSSGAVSVSGLDLSKDLSELLVSYENDQIYTFTIFPNAPPSGPTLSDIHKSNWYEDDDAMAENQTIPIQTEKASYGAHLNRFTFLKSAKYAGPNDEYICTGSDSGHVWIYVRKTGEVASLLRADNSTCNGVVPHPTLPFFVTYGIDSTAKLWRATVPVGDNVDDSPLGRYNGYVHTPYEKSALVSNWKAIQSKLSDMEYPRPHVEACLNNNINISLLPDQIPQTEEEGYENSIFGALLPRRSLLSSYNIPAHRIKNDYTYLPTILQKNYYAALKGKMDFVELMGEEEDEEDNDDEPIRSGLDALHKRVSLIRLYYQARRLGLVIPDESYPWIMSARKRLLQEDEECGYGHPADLIPDYSDWLMYDLEMTPNPKPFHHFEESDDYSDVEKNDSSHSTDMIDSQLKGKEDIIIQNSDKKDGTKPNEMEAQLDDENVSPIPHLPNDTTTYTPERAWEILTKTVLLLKEAGNEALRSNQNYLAATRYDKAIRYASIAYLPTCTPGNLSFLSSHIQTLKNNGNRETQWTPLLKAFISVRLNLSMTLLKPDMVDKKAAIDQASLALDALGPFCISSGKVFSGKNLEVSSPAPSSIYHECKELQAKAYFRLGTAQNMNKDYVSAISSLEKSIACSKDIGVTNTDPCVGRLLRDAKQELAKRKKRHRKKFKSMFSS